PYSPGWWRRTLLSPVYHDASSPCFCPARAGTCQCPGVWDACCYHWPGAFYSYCCILEEEVCQEIVREISMSLLALGYTPKRLCTCKRKLFILENSFLPILKSCLLTVILRYMKVSREGIGFHVDINLSPLPMLHMPSLNTL